MRTKALDRLRAITASGSSVSDSVLSVGHTSTNSQPAPGVRGGAFDGSVSSVSAPRDTLKNSSESLVDVTALQEEEEVYLSIYLKNNETRRSAPTQKIALSPTDKTDTPTKPPGAARGPCARCGQPVTWADGLRNWFGHLVHLTCPAPLAPRRPASWSEWREGDLCPSCGRAEHEHEGDFFGCSLPPVSDPAPAPLERKAPPPVAPVRWTERPDVVAVVEDLSDAGLKPGRIARDLGLRRGEVLTILRRTGR